MAIAPVNKFLNVAVPVAPGEQKLYEVPTGTSALLLYAQVANVGIGTYPTVTFIQRRETRSTGNTRDIRVIKDVEIPPNDAVILIDGRLVLEKTALVVDSLYMTGVQTGITTINNVTYDEPSGIVTVTCAGPHSFNIGDDITMAGIAFTCPDNTAGITTTIFPDPQKAYVINTIVNEEGVAGTAKTFTSIVGGAKGYKHVYNAAIHSFVRAKPDAISKTNLSNTTKYNVTNSYYSGDTGIATFTIPDHQMVVSGGTVNGTSGNGTIVQAGTSYNGQVGILTVQINGHALSTGDLVRFDDETFWFKCELDENDKVHKYPRSQIDPMSGTWKAIEKIDNDSFKLNVGRTDLKKQFYTVSEAQYTPNTGILTATIGNHNLVAGVSSIRLSDQSFGFTCNHGSDNWTNTKYYPRANGEGGATSNDQAYREAVGIAATTDTTITIDVGDAGGSNTEHRYVPNPKLQPSTASYTPGTGVLQITVNGHGLDTGDHVKLDDGCLTFSCDYGNYSGINSHKSYPRVTDPISNQWCEVEKVDANNFKIKGSGIDGVGISPDTSPHTFVSATAGITRAQIRYSSAWEHTFISGVTGGVKKATAATSTIGIATEGIIYTCTMDNNQTEHAYPRTTDPKHNVPVEIIEATYNNISVNVGVSSAGGQVAPLQMEFTASILENSNA